MNYFNEIGKTALSIKAIYACRKTPLYISIAFFLMINIGFTFPFVVSMLTLNQVSLESFITPEIVEEVNLDLTADVLKGLYFEDDRLQSKDGVVKQEIFIGDIKVLIDLEDQEDSEATRDTYIARITEEYMELNYGMQLFSDYNNFELRDLEDMSNSDILDYFLVNGLRGSTKQWYFPISSLFYIVFTSMNTFFIFGMSLIAMLFRFGDNIKLKYKETLNIVIYCSVLPTVITVILTLMFDILGLNLILYNFGTFAMYIIVRRKFLKNPKKEKEVIRA